jgi:hypothetical protein
VQELFSALMSQEPRSYSMNYDLIGAYKIGSKFGWAGYNKEGNTWTVDAQTGQQLEADRMARNVKNGRPASPVEIKTDKKDSELESPH